MPIRCMQNTLYELTSRATSYRIHDEEEEKEAREERMMINSLCNLLLWHAQLYIFFFVFCLEFLSLYTLCWNIGKIVDVFKVSFEGADVVFYRTVP